MCKPLPWLLYLLSIAISALGGCFYIDTHLSEKALALSEAEPIPTSLPSSLPASPQLSNQKSIEADAQQITVKIVSDKNQGSGILIQHQGERYWVITNQHVVRSAKTLQVQTSDGKLHKAEQSRTVNFHTEDLALLTFKDPQGKYFVAQLGQASQLMVGDLVFAAGFPFGANTSQALGFRFTVGRVSLVSAKPLVGGYQIGYTNAVQKGMSGGPVLNEQGQLIAINGLHAEPLWDNPHVYQDQSQPCEPLKAFMEDFSWAIPLETFLHYAANSLQLTNVSTNLMPFPTVNPGTEWDMGAFHALSWEVIWLRLKAKTAQRCKPFPFSPQARSQ